MAVQASEKVNDQGRVTTVEVVSLGKNVERFRQPLKPNAWKLIFTCNTLKIPTLMSAFL